MVFEHIENLKQQFTDKYVVVDEARPELRRFKGMTGLIKTVNMNGRALVEFDAHGNIGWYDIEIDYLKLIDKPLPKEETVAKPAAKKTAAKAPSNLEKARASDGKQTVTDVLAAARGKPAAATAPAQDSKAMSVTDVLAAARGGQGKGTAPVATKTESQDVAAIMEAARKPKGDTVPAPAKAAARPAPASGNDPQSMSVAEIMAAARAEKNSDGQAAPQPSVTDQPVSAGSEPESAEEPESAASAATEDTSAAPIDDLPTDVAGIIAFCKQRDGA